MCGQDWSGSPVTKSHHSPSGISTLSKNSSAVGDPLIYCPLEEYSSPSCPSTHAKLVKMSAYLEAF
jgi:hypothetical protein